ncbi:MAG: hypothetical protein EOO15_01725 [Chitinophagaceae bacterium]|nr:MAG: hypothetical protein EOO15_01725 [Chitinophagaceae bacterium]
MKHYNYEIVWQKYLPVIRIVMKRALGGDQLLKLNAPDFERLGLTRKSGYKFDVRLQQGKLAEVIIDHPLAASMAQVLLNDDAINALLAGREFEISLSSRYELSIRHIAAPLTPEHETEQAHDMP